MDVKTAFLYGKINHEILLCIPKGLNYDKEKYALRLKRSIYGLKMSSKTWFERLRVEIGNMKFEQLPADRCIYYKREGTTLAVIIVYVDDILCACNDEKLIKKCLDHLEKKFKMKIIRKPKNFLGIEIERDKESKTTKLYQRDYTYRVLERFGMLDSHPKMTPMETNLQIEKTGIRNEDTEVRSLIGALLYLSRNTRPDISFAVNYISRFQSESTPQILIYGKRILRYLKGTIDMGSIFDSNGQRAVTAFVDASFASAKEDQL